MKPYKRPKAEGPLRDDETLKALEVISEQLEKLTEMVRPPTVIGPR